MSAPSTPKQKSADQANPSSQTGTWKHPQFDQIVKRQNASTFTSRNLARSAWNVGGLIVLWLASRGAQNTFPSLLQSGKNFQQYTNYAYYFFQVIFLYNIFVACLPLIRTPDEINDIALTPAQRKLMGLAPSSAPPTPGSSYITPPRYARTPTPMSSSPGSKDRYGESPSMRRESPSNGGLSGSPYSPGASPLLQKAVGGGYNSARRNSHGSGSPLGFGASRSSFSEAPSTPTPSGSKNSSIALNSKWLYEKGRRNSGKLF